MWIENNIFKEDLQQIVLDINIPWRMLEGKTVLITGATGLIGVTLVSSLLYYGLASKNPPRVLALVRNYEKALKIFSGQLADSASLKLIRGDVCNLSPIDEPIDYIIHGASVTSSKAFIESPVETIKTTLFGTENILTLAKENKVHGFVYLSSMEVYGSPKNDVLLTENDVDYLNPLLVRSSYPESKRMAEAMCCAYASEYNVPVCIARLAQSFGPGVASNDERVFAMFARCSLRGDNIVLHTDGLSTRMYLYTLDASAALLTLLIKGEAGLAYNVANEETYCSILEMAQMVADNFSDGKTKISFAELPEGGIYPPSHHLRLDVTRLKELGWRARVDLMEMYRRMISCM